MPYFITDAQFTADGRNIVTRDFFHLRVWDLAMTKEPKLKIPLHESIRPALYDNLQQNALAMPDYTPMDKFDVSCSPDSRFVATGSYNQRFFVFDITTGLMDANIEAPRVQQVKRKKSQALTAPLSREREREYYATNFVEPLTPTTVDFNKKLAKLAWHPRFNLLSLASCSNLYLYSE